MNNAEQTPTILVIFGLTGDLAERYLMPALYSLTSTGAFHPNTKIVGITRGDTTTEELYAKAQASIAEANGSCDPETLEAMRIRTEMFKMDLDDPQGYTSLLERLNHLEDLAGTCMNRLYWLSIPPKAYPPVIELLGEQGLNKSCQHDGAATRLIVEKPFGSDLASAEALLQETAKHFSEEQTFRIDHYMAKQTVRDILETRFKEKDREARWDKDHIDSIEIIAKEKIGIEGRATFYEPLGALRDFIQNHLMQILGIVTMDVPDQLDSASIHANKESLLSRIESIPSDQVTSRALRGQYKGYRQEVNNPDSNTETFASVILNIDTPRWSGVEINLLTGKALDERKAEVKVTFKDGGSIVFSIQGEANQPGSKSFTAYKKVFADAIDGDHSLFSTSREILESWRILQPVLNYWSTTNEDLHFYEQGSPGPSIEDIT